MRKMDKNVLSCSELTDMVTLWLCQPSSQLLFRFKTAQKVPEVEAGFLKKCISYLVLRNFSWVISDISQQTIVSLNQQLKVEYKEMMVSSSFRTSATFQIFIIIVIKRTSLFLTQHFNNIMVDAALQSEMCIILFYTFLGLQVTQKTYQVIHKKYACKDGASSKGRGNEFVKTSKNSFNDGNALKSSKKLTNFKLNKASGQSRRSHQSIRKPPRDAQQRQLLQEFTVLLKENLHVEPLPPLKRKKRNIRELQRLNTEPCEANERSLSKSDGLSPKCIYSNQLSNSFKLCHPQSLLFELTSKKVKLNQSFYNFKLERKTEMARQASSEGVLNRSLECQSSPANAPKGCLNWQQIVSQLKKKSINPKKKKQQQRQSDESPSQMQAIFEQSSLRSTSYQASTLPTLQKQPSSHATQILKQIDSKQSSNECFKRQSHNKLTSSFSIKNFQEAQQRLSAFFPKAKRSRLDKNSIRLDKDSFFSTCSVRKSQLDAQKINLHADWIINHYKS